MKVFSFPRLAADRIRTAHAADPRRLRLAFFALLTVIVVLMSAKYAAKISKPGDSGQQSRSAFLRWRELINGVFRGENIYVGVNEYPNPPIMAVLLRPFAALPPVIGALAWFYAKVLLAVLAAAWVFRLVSEKRPTPPAPLPEGKGEGSEEPNPPAPFPKREGGYDRSAVRSPSPRSGPREALLRGPESKRGGVGEGPRFASTSRRPRRSFCACRRCSATCLTTTSTSSFCFSWSAAWRRSGAGSTPSPG